MSAARDTVNAYLLRMAVSIEPLTPEERAEAVAALAEVDAELDAQITRLASERHTLAVLGQDWANPGYAAKALTWGETYGVTNCSACGCTYSQKGKFCPHCGAKCEAAPVPADGDTP